jgi:hypothetical protein
MAGINIYVWFEDNCNPILHKRKILYDNNYSFQHCLIMLTSLIATPTHSPQTQMAVSIILEQINYLFLRQAPLLQALNQYLFIKKRQQYH